MEHFIKNIEITNFKSIRHAEIKDCRRVNVFIGYPNVGKSNILEAMSSFSVVFDLVKLKDVIRVTKDSTIFFDGKINENFLVKLDDNYQLEGKYKNGNFFIENYILNRRVLFGSGREALEYAAMPYKYKTTIFKNFITEKTQNLLVRDAEVYSPILKKYSYRKSDKNQTGDLQVLDYPWGYNLFLVIQNNLKIRKELASLLKIYNLEMLFDLNNQSFSLLKRVDEGTVFSVDYELIADTLQRLFFYKTAILSNKNQILLLEEPESHMFPPYISQLTSDIIHEKNQNQFFTATHSPFVLNDLIEDVEKEELAIYIVSYDKENGETLIHRMSDEETNEAYQFGYDFFMNINNFIPEEQHEKV